MRKYKFIISGGGTGGHIFPAISIADELKFRFSQSDLLFVGARDRMEMIKVPAHGYKIKGLWISGFKRKLSLGNLLFPFKVVYSLFHSLIIISKFKPEVVIGTGGFASGPILFIASLFKIPTLIQEQNSYPGITTRLYADKAQVVCIAFDEAKNYLKGHCIVTGNPTRKSILNGHRSDAAKTFNFSPGKDTVFLFGGSQGSAALNKIMNTAINSLQQEDIQVIWQTGYNQFSKFQHHDSDAIRVVPFIDLMSDAYALSDLIISRAGALTLSEITVCGKPSILIPFPGAAGDHQMKNAKVLAKANAAQLIDEKDLSSSLLVKTVLKLLHNKEKLEQMAHQTKNLAKPDATETIVDQIFQMIDKN